MDYRRIMDPRNRGLGLAALRLILRIAAIPYGWVVRSRNRQFDRGRREVLRVNVPVISIGNVTAGGTGKTPMVAAVAKHLRNQGVRVALISRGYRSDESGSNDEARELYDRLPDVPHLQNPDRVAAANAAVDELEMETILLDDGFQHRRLHRDLNVVMLDATCPFGYGNLLPAGLLREPLTALRRADFIMLSRTGHVSRDAICEIERTLQQVAPEIPIGYSDHIPTGWLSHPHQRHSLESIRGCPAIAFAGIGNPDPFFESVRKQGLDLVDQRALPDHCEYPKEVVESLRAWIAEQRARHPELVAVCTHKDLVKIRANALGGASLYALQIDLAIAQGAESFWKLVDQTTSGQPVRQETVR